MLDDTVMAALLQMIEAGGALALWGIVAYYGMNILRIVAIGGVLWVLLRTLFSGGLLVASVINNYKCSRVSLLSQEVSEEISNTFKRCSEDLSKTSGVIKSAASSLDAAVPRLETALQGLCAILEKIDLGSETESEGADNG